jgi:putative mRNA 3-end processing factor
MLIQHTSRGLYCPAGDFYIDPWLPVPRAVITHAHGDHARFGCDSYLCAVPGVEPLSLRVEGTIQPIGYGEQIGINGVRVSLHPAGHVLGSAQVRVEVKGEVWVVSGDYKRESDPTCAPFEVVSCHTFITESTFGLPVYRWPAGERVITQIYEWWSANATAGRPSVLLSYVMGKSQRILAMLGEYDELPGPVYAHGALQQMNEAYRRAGIALMDAPNPVSVENPRDVFTTALVLAPPSAHSSSWLKRFKGCAVGRVSGWMRIRGRRRRLALDKGFVMSDHADWPALLTTISETGAERVIAIHGNGSALTRFLVEQGVCAEAWTDKEWPEGEEQVQ